MPDAPRTLAERLRYLRKQRGLTQVEVAAALGCEQAMVSSWEVARTRPSAVALAAIARHFDVTLLALETGEGFVEEAARSLRDASAAANHAAHPAETLTLELPTVGAGRLMLLDQTAGRQEPVDPADAMAQLLRALKRGRQAWVVLK